MTEFSRSIANNRFVVVCHPALKDQAEGLLDVMETMASAGTRFKSGETFNFGGLVFSLQSRGADVLVGRPILEGKAVLGREEDISQMLSALRSQLSVAYLVNVEPTQTDISDRMIFERDCMEEKKVYLERSMPSSPGDSGWFIGTAEKEGSSRDRELVSGRVWELFLHRPPLLSALALPHDYAAVFEGDKIVAVLSPSNKNLWGRSG